MYIVVNYPPTGDIINFSLFFMSIILNENKDNIYLSTYVFSLLNSFIVRNSSIVRWVSEISFCKYREYYAIF